MSGKHTGLLGVLGQVTCGKRTFTGGTPTTGQQFEYTFDHIGNRSLVKMGGDASGQNLRQVSYSSNLLNQYTTRGISNSMDFMGYAPTTSSVTINNQAAYRFGEFYHKLLGWTNSAAAVFQQVTTVVNPGATTSTYAFIPLTPEAFSYDADGNLLSDGRWDYTWNGENQLTVMQTHSTLAGIGMPLVKLEFAYDYVGRRCQKKAYLGQGSTGGQSIKDGGSGTGGEAPEGTGSGVTWTLKSDTRYVWDGWNLIAELNGLTSYSSIRTYAWGLDLSGSEQGAGGIGGLAFETDAVTNTTYHPCFDGNGNLMSLRTTGGVVAAGYEYGPFGESLLTRGDYAPNNPFQFSTKYADAESGLLYYGYRYYNASTGRWLGRDPIGESDSSNLFAFVSNQPIVGVDPLGLWTWKGGKRQGAARAIMIPDPWDIHVDGAAQFAGLEPSESEKWLYDETAKVWVKPNKYLNRCHEYSVPNVVYATAGDIGGTKLGRFPTPLRRQSIRRLDQYASRMSAKGYQVIKNIDMSLAQLKSTLKKRDITAWYFIGHGAEGSIYTKNKRNADGTRVGARPLDLLPDQHHKLSAVVLMVCEAASASDWSVPHRREITWQDLVSRYGTLHATCNKIRPILSDDEDLPENPDAP